MKKFVFLLIAVILCLYLAGCSNSKTTDPLQSIWATRYNDDKSQIMFSFEHTGKSDSGDLDICIWDYSEEDGDLVQTANYVGTYSANSQDGSFVLLYNGVSYDFTYEMKEKESIIITSGTNIFDAVVNAYGSDVFELNYIRDNEAN